MIKRYLFLLAMMLNALWASAQFSGSGKGTASDPYLIFNAIQLDQMRNFLNQGEVVFELKNDIDLTSFISENYPNEGWLPVGTSGSPFKGILKGNNHTIKGLVINRPSLQNVGLFGHAYNVTITDLTIKGFVEGNNAVGLLAGYIYGNSATISNCTLNIDREKHINAVNVGGAIGIIDGMVNLTNVTVNGAIDGNNYVGGCVGYTYKYAKVTFTSCKHNGNLKGTSAVGGIIGGAGPYSIRGMENCSQFGRIIGGDSTGGLIGIIEDGVSNNSLTCNVNNCVCIGDVSGEDYVGGLIGRDDSYNYSYYCVKLYNSYYNGTVSGKNNVGGLVGCKKKSEIKKCYTHATVLGVDNVGGLIGNGVGSVTMKACVANNLKVSSTTANVGRIYGYWNGGSLGELGTADGNLSYNQTVVSQSGVVQKVNDNLQNGTSVGPQLLRLMATYVAKGWDFNNDWAIQETECLPYKRYQAAPPVIESSLCSGETSISGKSVNGGTVYLYYKDKGVVSKECNGHNWTFDTEKLQSGALVRIYTVAPNMVPSYLTSTNVNFPGSGTEEDPYRVYDAYDLQGVTKNGYYKVMNDIDLTSWIQENNPSGGWEPVGRTGAQKTYVDGDGHAIKGLWINSTNDWTGLFSNLDAGYIKNLTVETAAGKKVKGGDCTGILVGRNANGTIQNCIVKGTVEGTKRVGGIAGVSENDVIQQCRVEATVKATTENAMAGGAFGQIGGGTVREIQANATVTTSGNNAYTGGLIGENGADVQRSTSSGSVTATGDGAKTGGLVGYNKKTVTDSYSKANVKGTEYTAGLVGYSEGAIKRCYAQGNINGSKYGAGVVAQMYGSNASAANCVAVNNLIVLTDQSAWGCRVIGGYSNGCPDPARNNYALNTMQVTLNNNPQRKEDDLVEGIAKTVEELMSATTYSALGWNTNEVWGFNEGSSYPYLKYENVIPVSSIVLSKTDAKLALGETVNLSVTIAPENAADKGVVWTTDNNAVCKVSATGLVTAVAEGKANITATATDGSGVKATCVVTVATAEEIVLPDYAFSIAPVSTTSGEEVCLSVNMANKNDINGFQFDIVLPEGVTAKKNSKGKYIFNAGERCDDHTFSSRMQQDGSIRVVCTSPTNEVFEGHDGEICQIPLCVDPSLVNGQYTVQFKNIALSDTKSANIKVENAQTEIHVINDYLTAESVVGFVGKNFVVPVSMTNKTSDICSFQFDVNMPEGFSMSKDANGKCAISLGSRGDDHVFSTFDRGNNVVRVVCTSLTNTPFADNSGVLCNLSLVASKAVEDGTYDIFITNIAASNTQAVNIPMPDIKSTVTMKSFMAGDVNNDTEISVADATAAISFVLGNSQESFVFAAADMDGDGVVMVNDVTAIIGIVLSEGLSGNSRSMARARTARKASDVKNNLYVEPFAIEPGETKDINIILDNPNITINGWQTDITLPEGFSFELTKKGKYTMSYNEDRTDGYTLVAAKQQDGSVRVLGYESSNTPIEGTTGAIMQIKIKADDALAAGVYNIELKNTSLSDEKSKAVRLENTVSSLLTGDLSDVEQIALNGGWDEDAIYALNDKLSTNKVITTVDMSTALAMDASSSVATANPNTLIYLPNGMTLENDKNVVCGNTCAHLVLTDGCPFAVASEFEAAEAEYSRTLPADWGTICMPFELTSDETVQYYTLSSVENDVMKLTSVETVEAGMPVVFKRMNGQDLDIHVSNATVTEGSRSWNVAVNGDDWTMKGAYTSSTIDPTAVGNQDKAIYYINGNKFWYGEYSFDVPAFRGWFEAPKATNARSLSFIVDGDTTTAVEAVEKADGCIEIITDLSGRIVPTAVKGVSIINNKKVLNK